MTFSECWPPLGQHCIVVADVGEQSQQIYSCDRVDGHAARGVAAVCRVAAGGAHYYHQRDRRGIKYSVCIGGAWLIRESIGGVLGTMLGQTKSLQTQTHRLKTLAISWTRLISLGPKPVETKTQHQVQYINIIIYPVE